MKSETAFIFDLDGTLLDNVYVHVIAWQQAFHDEGAVISAMEIHRRIGLSGDMFTRALLYQQKIKIGEPLLKRLDKAHQEHYQQQAALVSPLPGARELLEHLRRHKTPFAIATTAEPQTAKPDLEKLGVKPKTDVVITRADVKGGKPKPDLFTAAAKRLRTPRGRAIIVGDSIWDMLATRRAGGFGVGLLSGGYTKEELLGAGASRVYVDAADLLKHLEEVGGPPLWPAPSS